MAPVYCLHTHQQHNSEPNFISILSPNLAEHCASTLVQSIIDARRPVKMCCVSHTNFYYTECNHFDHRERSPEVVQCRYLALTCTGNRDAREAAMEQCRRISRQPFDRAHYCMSFPWRRKWVRVLNTLAAEYGLRLRLLLS